MHFPIIDNFVDKGLSLTRNRDERVSGVAGVPCQSAHLGLCAKSISVQ